MTNAARDLKGMVEETKRKKRAKAKADKGFPDLDQKHSQAQDVPPEFTEEVKSEKADTSTSKQSSGLGAKAKEYSDIVMPHIKQGAEKVTSFLGETGIAVAINTALTLTGIYFLSKLGIGALLGLAVIAGVGVGLKYTSNVIAGRGFNPLKNMQTA